MAEPWLYDTRAVELPTGWNRLDDGRIVSKQAVFYPNGTSFTLSDGFGLTF